MAIVALWGCDGSGSGDAGTGMPDASLPDASVGPGMDAATDAAMPAVDGGGGGTTFLGCEGSGSCEGLSQTGCDFGMPLGCMPAYEERCNVRGCTAFDIGACGTDDMGCIWNEDLERCEDDPVCPTLTTQSDCTTRGCTWLRTLSGCTGTYDCAALSDMITGVDAGTLPPNPCEMVGPFGLSCTSRYE